MSAPHAARLQQGDPVHRNHRHHGAGQYQDARHQEEGPAPAGRIRTSLPPIDFRRGRHPRDQAEYRRQGDGEVQPGIGKAGAPPADLLDEAGRGRPADGAGAPAPQRQVVMADLASAP